MKIFMKFLQFTTEVLVKRNCCRSPVYNHFFFFLPFSVFFSLIYSELSLFISSTYGNFFPILLPRFSFHLMLLGSFNNGMCRRLILDRIRRNEIMTGRYRNSLFFVCFNSRENLFTLNGLNVNEASSFH